MSKRRPKAPVEVLKNIRTILARSTYQPHEFAPVLEAVAYLDAEIEAAGGADVEVK